MPVKIYMNLNSNFSPSLAQSKTVATANLGAIPKLNNSLKSPIIARIHNIKPGCGSCGR